jgi:hypothetical protein
LAKTFGINIDKDVVRRVLAAHYRPERDDGPSWLFGQLEHGSTGAVFSGLKDLKCVGVALGQSLSGEGGLNEFELFQVQAAEAAMVGVHGFARLAEGGTENADGVKPVGLDFEVKWSERLHDGHIIRYIHIHVNTMMHIVWLQLKH